MLIGQGLPSLATDCCVPSGLAYGVVLKLFRKAIKRRLVSKPGACLAISAEKARRIKMLVLNSGYDSKDVAAGGPAVDPTAIVTDLKALA